MASVQEDFRERHQFYQSRCQAIFEMYLSFTFEKLEKYVQNQGKTNRLQSGLVGWEILVKKLK